MTIDDELLLELIKPDSKGNIGDDAPILNIVGHKEIWYTLEESTMQTVTYGGKSANKVDVIKMTPDVVLAKKEVTYPSGQHVRIPKNGIVSAYGNIAIEIENDIQWDFQDSLKQLKKYRNNFPDTRVIIPKDYERFAPLYKNEGFRVYIWRGKRRWQCLKFETENIKEGPVIPRCSCGNRSQNDFRLIGLKDARFDEFNSNVP